MDKNIKITTLLTEKEIQNKILELSTVINNIYQEEELYLICVLKGSVMFMTDLAKRLTMPVKMEFIRVSSYGSQTISSGKVNPIDINLPDLNDKNVLIVEDIIDTGYTAEFLINYMKNNYKVKTLKFCTLLNKKSRRKTDIEADFCCFEIDDKYVVGYGLDADGCYRNLPYVGYIET